MRTTAHRSRRAPTRGLCAAAIVAAVALAGCGGGGGGGDPKPSISPSAVAKLNSRLDVVQRQFDAGGGACSDITGSSTDSTRAVIKGDLEALPESVDADTRKALNDSFDRLFRLVDDQCKATTTPAPTTTQETQSVPTDTHETQTRETQTRETQTQPEKPQKPEKPQQPEKPKGNGGGGDGGGGSSNGGAGIGGGER